MMKKKEPYYGTIMIGKDEIRKMPLIVGPAFDEFSKFHPLGWYAAIKNPDRKWWQFWKPKTKGVWGELRRAPNIPGNIPDYLAGEDK
jgi:hypothetical protein